MQVSALSKPVPLRHGGLGIQNPTKTAESEYQSSRSITAQLTQLIISQNPSLSSLDRKKVEDAKKEVYEEK